jgi:beta-galactosidase
MIELKNRQILIDGKPRLIMAGEVHYFRLKRDEWQDRIDKLKASGCNTVASYIPWLCHEPIEGQIDLDGHTRPELDLGAFIDLCKDNGLYFFARPGPFIMAEMKNEGLPYWVYIKHSEIIPITWDGKLAPTRTVDYLAPGFLEEARHWYSEVMQVIAPRLYTNGGNIIAVQLDNEIGMLSWVSNSPDLTDNVISDFVAWLREHYDEATLKTRYPFPLDNHELASLDIRSPRDDYAAGLMRDLGYYMRDRFARYVAALKSYAEEFGVTGVPFVINVHGTDQGRGFSYPIGISQLYESYTQGPDYIAGSDHYLGDLTIRNFQDLYLINAFMEAVNNPDQPITSVEFEAGSGDYAGGYGGRYDPATVDFKIRMCVAQGNRLLSFYLFTGGINYLLDQPPHDGNDRISFTGERHGVAAPVNPEGKLSYTFGRFSRSIKTMMAMADKLAVMEEERDNVAFAFIPDYYMTESKYPGSGAMSAIVENLQANRGPDAWEIMVKSMLLGGYRFGSVNIQDRPLDPDETPVLTLASARYMDGALQQKLLDYVQGGGKVLLYGEIPLQDMEGKPCILLADALGLKPAGHRRAETFYYLSLHADGWLAPRPETRTHFAQLFDPSKGEVIMRVAGTDEACGFDIKVGKGRVIALTASYTADPEFFRQILENLGATASLRHDNPDFGIFMTTSGSRDGERFLHVINLDGFDKQLHITEDGKSLLDGRSLVLRSREAFMLPLNVKLADDLRIVYSTAEVAEVTDGEIHFRLTQPEDVIVLETTRKPQQSDDYRMETSGKTTTITSRKNAAIDDKLVLRWE